MEDPQNNPTAGLGTVMAILTWVLGLMLLTVFFNHWYNKNKMNTQVAIVTKEGVEETILTRNYNNQYMAKGLINGQEVVFLLDTGATEVVIPGTIAKKLNLAEGLQGMATTAAGNVIIYSTLIKELIIGHIHLYNIKASINPSMKGDEVLLGMSALRKIQFTQQDDSLVLRVKKTQ